MMTMLLSLSFFLIFHCGQGDFRVAGSVRLVTLMKCSAPLLSRVSVAQEGVTVAIVKDDPIGRVYRKLVFSADGSRLVGGILVGDASDYQVRQRTSRFPGCFFYGANDDEVDVILMSLLLLIMALLLYMVLLSVWMTIVVTITTSIRNRMMEIASVMMAGMPERLTIGMPIIT